MHVGVVGYKTGAAALEPIGVGAPRRLGAQRRCQYDALSAARHDGSIHVLASAGPGRSGRTVTTDAASKEGKG
jgi:hypothetical protein